MRALIIDDSDSKRAAVTTAIAKVKASPPVEVDYATSVYQAIQKMNAVYDLIILDLVLPSMEGGAPDAANGKHLLDAIVSGRHGIKQPQHIVGLSEYPEAMESSQQAFSGRLLTLLRYDSSSSEWESPLCARIQYLIEAIADSTSQDEAFAYDLAVVCALPVPEETAVLRLPWLWKDSFVSSDHTLYRSGTFSNAGIARRVVLGCAARMGSAASAVLSQKMIHLFRPRYLACVGIAAGVRGQVEIGDAIIADPSWDWGSGKWTLRGEERVFLPSVHQVGLDPPLRELFRQLGGDASFLGTLRSEWPGGKPTTALSVHIGPVASGAAVLADGATALEIQNQNRKLLAIEMEIYGVYAAAAEAQRPAPTPFAIKAIVDFADNQKEDGFQPYGAHVSAGVLRRFAENYLPL